MRIALGDLLIGATALELGYGLITHDVRHFRMIPDLFGDTVVRNQGLRLDGKRAATLPPAR